jgi:PKD repeat protein
MILSVAVTARADVLVAEGAGMTYLANSSDPGLAMSWVAEGFDDGSWSAGVYGIGYENASGAENLITTQVPFGTRSIYTRAEFTIDDVTTVQNLFIGADYDDGYVAWINGVEVYRSPQMPAGALIWNTLPASHESSNGASPDYGFLEDVSSVGIPELNTGVNVLAVAVWNRGSTSSDLVLVPQLAVNVPLTLIRGPYLQLGTANSVVVRWRTSAATDSRVRFGPAPGALVETVDDATLTSQHEIEIAGLSPDTEYFYAVGSTATTLAGGDAEHFFRTAPLSGARRPLRIWAIGDSGTADDNARAVRDAYLGVADLHTDLWLMLGDNAYDDGTQTEYQAAVFEMYPEMLRTSVVWPTLGNHDGHSADSVSETGPYYDMFTLPDTAQAGGLSSGTEAYYAFDFGNVHFVCLNSYDIDRATSGAMLQWLALDLANTVQDWIVAYWHHPPYSKGSHNSDTEVELVEMRENALPILEDWGVDLVLSGHSHSYERSFLLDGHYDVSGTLAPTMKLDGGNGRIDGDGAYQKATAGPAAHEGAVYVVAGSSGKLSGGTLDHPAMYLSLNQLGSLVLDVDGDRLQLRFIDDQAVLRDYFTLVKNTATLPQADFVTSPQVGPAPLSVEFTNLSTTNAAAWSWDLNGDDVADTTEQHPGFVYSAPGSYTVGLTATNATGADLETKVGYICVSEGAVGQVSGVRMEPGKSTLSWNATAFAARYDLLKGDLLQLRSGGGDFAASVTSCVEDNGTDESGEDTDAPAQNQGFYYLVRAASSCDEPGSYDSSGTQQQSPRDPSIAASTQSCP